MFGRCLAALVVVLSAPVFAAERPDIVIADFESETWGDWQVEGDAFGPGPAKGTLYRTRSRSPTIEKLYFPMCARPAGLWKSAVASSMWPTAVPAIPATRAS